MGEEQWNLIAALYSHAARSLIEIVVELDRAMGTGADGLMLLDRDGAATFVNPGAAEILDKGDGLSICNGAIVARRGPESRRLTGHIRDVLEGSRPDFGGHALLVTRPSGERPYLVRVLPPQDNPLDGAARSVACVLQFHDLAYRRTPASRTLRDTYGLTRREANLAAQLVRMGSLKSAAAAVGMAINTARNHLRAIFLKMETVSQVETVQLLSKIP